LSSGESLDCTFVAPVERFLQEFGAQLAFAGQAHAETVQIVLAGGLHTADLELNQHVPQFGRRQAGPDDRAVKATAEFPDPSSAWTRCGLCGGLPRVGINLDRFSQPN